MPTDAVLADIDDALANTGGRVIVGVIGPPGAGKTTLAREIVEHYRAAAGDQFAGYLPMDGFHLSNSVLTQLDRTDRKGAPDTFDADALIDVLRRVAAANSDVYVPDFDHTVGEPVGAGLIVPAAARLVAAEGNYLGLDRPPWSQCRSLLHRLYYVDAPGPVRRERLLRRHRAAGRTAAEADTWIDSVDEPNARLIDSTRPRADIVICEESHG